VKCLLTTVAAILVASLVTLSGCAHAFEPEPILDDPGQCSVLFIGNSLTYFNKQPDIFREMAAASGKAVLVGEATEPGVALNFHARNAETLRKIRNRKWDFVVLQQANWEVAFPEYHAQLTGPLESLKDAILSNNTDTRILYAMDYSAKRGLTWFGRYRGFSEATEMLRDGTIALSEGMGFSVAPVGWAFHQVARDRPELELFASDGLHPSYLGSYLGAAVYFATVFGENAQGNSYRGLATPQAAGILQEVGSRVVLDRPSVWLLPEGGDPCGLSSGLSSSP
jgi:hypothetical protein